MKLQKTGLNKRSKVKGDVRRAMIFVTGDTHRELDLEKLHTSHFPMQKELTRNDYLIICGDFGAVWNNSKYDDSTLDYHNKKPYTTLFVDGNHENFDLLNGYKIEEWHGGKIHRIRENVIHLMRGQIYTIDDKKFFVMGGARSIDKNNRIPFESWWPQESLTMAELNEAQTNLDKHHWEVDYVLSHTTSNIVMQECIGFQKEKEPVNEFFDILQRKLKYKWWFFGHFHIDEIFESHKSTCLYDLIRDLNNIEVGGLKQKDNICFSEDSMRMESLANILLHAIELIKYNYDQETCDNRTEGLLTKSDWYRLCEDFEDAINQEIASEATKVELIHAMMTDEYWKKWYERTCKS